MTASGDWGLFGAAWHVRPVCWTFSGMDLKPSAATAAAGNPAETPAHPAPEVTPMIDPPLHSSSKVTPAAAYLGWLPAEADD